jgi:uncharacterized RDD family membrane protein YckC
VRDAASSSDPRASADPARAGPSIGRRIAGMLYESLLAAAIVLTGAFVFFGIASALGGGGPIESDAISRRSLQVFLIALLAGYFVRCWTRGGQTLAMKAWKLRVAMPDGQPLTRSRALARFGLAAAIFGPALLAAGYLWKHPHAALAWLALAPALVDLAWPLADRDRQSLRDRLTGTRLIVAPPTTSSPPR